MNENNALHIWNATEKKIMMINDENDDVFLCGYIYL